MQKASWWFVLIFWDALTVLFTFWISSRCFIKAKEHKNTCPRVWFTPKKLIESFGAIWGKASLVLIQHWHQGGFSPDQSSSLAPPHYCRICSVANTLLTYGIWWKLVVKHCFSYVDVAFIFFHIFHTLFSWLNFPAQQQARKQRKMNGSIMESSSYISHK